MIIGKALWMVVDNHLLDWSSNFAGESANCGGTSEKEV